METPKTGYQVQSYDVPVKRYCQTLDLRNSPELIAEYRKRHSQAEAWPEILAGIREVGILEMEIYILGTRLFMIVETPLDFDGNIIRLNLITGFGCFHILLFFRVIYLWCNAASDNFSQFTKIGNFSFSHCLRQNVSHCSSFHRTCINRNAEFVSCQLVE